jgi:hypothetical protein
MRIVILLVVALVTFGVALAIGMALIPGARTETDYLVIGTAATLLALAVVFVMLISTTFKSRDTFARRRARSSADSSDQPASEDTPQS